jgi:hypothetical protein
VNAAGATFAQAAVPVVHGDLRHRLKEQSAHRSKGKQHRDHNRRDPQPDCPGRGAGARYGDERLIGGRHEPPSERDPFGLVRIEGGRRSLFVEHCRDLPRQDTSLWVRCITRGGLPGVMFPTVYNANIRLVQGPGYVAIMYEMIHDTRIIPTDGRPHVGSAVRQYFGDSTGRWDGDTLLVDVTNFTDKSSFRGSSGGLHLTERFRRIEKDVVRYEVTLDDPRTWTGSWTAALDMRRQAAGLLEYACHEGNYGLLNMLATSRVAEKSKK